MMTASKSAITLVEAARRVSFQPAASTGERLCRVRADVERGNLLRRFRCQ